MNPTELSPARFYQIFKVHKSHAPGSLQPGRRIISGNGSITEHISRFIDFHVKGLVPDIDSYLQDTPHFLRCIQDLNEGEIPPNAVLLTIDVSALYTNIPTGEGLDALADFLEARKDKSIPSDFIVKLMEKVLKLNIFEYDEKLFKQVLGTAMGTPSAVSYSNMFMSRIDRLLIHLALQMNNGEDPLMLLKRFIDDLFLIWTGPLQPLLAFLDEINNLHPTIKFTYAMTCPFTCDIPSDINHDCFCFSSKSIPFLDTLVTLKDWKISTDLFRKETDRCQYLLPSSCHPSHICKNIPYSLCYRLVRICSELDALESRLK